MDSLVSTRWLADQLGADDLVVLDATMHLPDNPRDAAAEYTAAHLPGARWLDLTSFVDTGSPVPKAVPTAEQFADRLGHLGITPDSRVVLYDDSQIRSSARAWFIFRLYGFEKVAILDGGLAKWKAEGRALEAGQTPAARSEFPVPAPGPSIRSKADMMANCDQGSEQVVDARDAARFAGEAGSGSAGHIPGAANVPFPLLFSEDGTYRAPEQIAALFAEAGVALGRPVVTSCNSGMTAAVLAFGLHLMGKQDVALYDGSWLEWGSDPDTPKQQGAAR
jgi:thiosulfate/3-mercaptopyruvate sulfurtransferase